MAKVTVEKCFRLQCLRISLIAYIQYVYTALPFSACGAFPVILNCAESCNLKNNVIFFHDQIGEMLFHPLFSSEALEQILLLWIASKCQEAQKEARHTPLLLL